MSTDNSTPYQSILSWPKEERPRERLAALGAGQLSNSELLAILIGSGTRGMSALDLARGLMKDFHSFRELSRHVEGREMKGLGEAKRARILAALEIGRRFRDEGSGPPAVKIRSSRDAADVLMGRLRDAPTESFYVLYLNAQNIMIQCRPEASGTVHFAQPILREIIARALKLHAVGLICVHNHPAGDTRPSPEDRRFTRKIKDAAELMQLRFIDHIIIGDNTYFSFADAGEIEGGMK